MYACGIEGGWGLLEIFSPDHNHSHDKASETDDEDVDIDHPVCGLRLSISGTWERKTSRGGPCSSIHTRACCPLGCVVMSSHLAGLLGTPQYVEAEQVFRERGARIHTAEGNAEIPAEPPFLFNLVNGIPRLRSRFGRVLGLELPKALVAAAGETVKKRNSEMPYQILSSSSLFVEQGSLPSPIYMAASTNACNVNRDVSYQRGTGRPT